MRIRLRKKTQPQILTGILLIFPFLFSTLIELFHAPYGVKYICDIGWFCLLFLLLRKKKWPVSLYRVAVAVVVYLLFTLVVYLPQMQSPLYYLWGFRNNFRFYVAFIAFAYFLREEDLEQQLKIFDWLFWINVPVSVIQFVLLGKDGDYLGGIFGVSVGCNAYTNIFFVLVVTKSLLFYLHKRESLFQCGAKCGLAMVIAAWAELKFFYVELIVILVAAVLLTDFSWKKVGIVAGGAVGIVLSVALLEKLFPEFQGFLSVEALLATATNTKGYTSTGDLNRLTTIPEISKRFLTTPILRLVGLGLGNCDLAGYDFLTSPFYRRYGSLHYSWFSTAITYLETGYIGLLFFFGFFVMAFLVARKKAKESDDNSRIYCQMAMIMAICAIMIGFYNSSLREEEAYMLYFVLAFPFIVGKRTAIETQPTQRKENVHEV